jgi:hypothetical protein
MIVFAHLSVDEDAVRARTALGSTIEDVAAFQGVAPADDLAVWGTPDAVARAVRRYEGAGVDSLVLRPAADPVRQLRALLVALRG